MPMPESSTLRLATLFWGVPATGLWVCFSPPCSPRYCCHHLYRSCESCHTHIDERPPEWIPNMPSTRRPDVHLHHTVRSGPAPVNDASCPGFRSTRGLLPVLFGGVGVGEGAHRVLMLQAFLDNLTGPGLGTLHDDIYATKDDQRLLRQLRATSVALPTAGCVIDTPWPHSRTTSHIRCCRIGREDVAGDLVAIPHQQLLHPVRYPP